MDNERRGSISDGSKWGKDYSYEDIMSKDEAYKAVYADVPDQGKADADDAPENELNEADPEDVSDAEESDVSKPSGEADDDDVFNDWVEDFSEEVNAGESELTEEPGSTDEPEPAEEAGSSDESEPVAGSESTDEPAQADEIEPAEESEDAGEIEPAEEAGSTDEPEPAEETESTDEPGSVEKPEDAGETEPAEGPGSTDEPEQTDESTPGGDEPVPIDPEKLKKRRMLIGGIAGLCVVALIAGSQIHKHYKEFYTTHFFNGTVINGEDASKKTVEEVKDDIKKNVSHYNLKIKELNRDEKITAQDVGLEYVDDGKVDELMEEQEEGKWFLHLAGTTEFDVNAGTKYDEGKLTETIAGLECFKEENVTKPQNATLKDENNVFSIQDEVEGNEVNLEKFTAAVKEALDKGGTSIDIVKNDCYNHPTIYRDNETLKARMDKWNEYMRVNVTYAFGDNIEVVNADTVKPNVVDDGSTVDLPTDWIRTLVYGWGQKYDTFGLAREFTTHSGETVMVEEGGDYGWVIDKDVTIADVTDAILTGAQGERPVTFLYSAMGWDNGDLTGTYVEVSIAEQHLWCYKDYELVMDTDVVTGLPTTERGTTPGTFAVDAKKEDAVLGSLDVQG
ncbi:MAG: peptidoglycan binding domain-containing protein, partial [Lachnospiraceae bacterium]|nr:peptidoglycan binding domain-containing protein [Lachnospiraceae bacterium]